MADANVAPRTVFTHFYDHLWIRDHTSWPITGFEERDDPSKQTWGPNEYWFRQELQDLDRAGIDVMALMYWAPNGVDEQGGREQWRRMLRVISERQGREFHVPKICCHYDGMGFGDLKGLDLGGDEGIDTVFAHMAQFYDFWLADEQRRDLLFTHDGADVCFMYRPEALGECKCPPGGRYADGLRRRFAERYPGRKLYLVLDMLWTWTYDTNDLHANNADNYYFWGASQTGPTIPGGERFPAEIQRKFLIHAIGPGFQDAGHNQSNTPNSQIGKRSREWRDGQTFREDWSAAIEKRHEAPWVMLETWNLFLERSEICCNNFVGDLFIDICAEMKPKFLAP